MNGIFIGGKAIKQSNKLQLRLECTYSGSCFLMDPEIGPWESRCLSHHPLSLSAGPCVAGVVFVDVGTGTRLDVINVRDEIYIIYCFHISMYVCRSIFGFVWTCHKEKKGR